MRLSGLVPVLFGLLVSVAACGGKSNESGGGGGGAATMCQALDDQPAYQVPVLIINERPEAIHLGVDMVTCDVPPLFEVEGEEGTPLPVPRGCRQSCSLLRVDGPVGCPGLCALPNAVTLAPGDSSTSAFYSGLYQVAAELPRECLPKQQQEQPGACDQARQIQPGTYTFRARAGASLDCSASGSESCSPCTSSSSGGCSTPGALIAGEILTAETVVVLDASYGVVPSVPPGADQKAAPSDAPSGQVQQVQIIFK